MLNIAAFLRNWVAPIQEQAIFAVHLPRLLCGDVIQCQGRPPTSFVLKGMFAKGLFLGAYWRRWERELSQLMLIMELCR